MNLEKEALEELPLYFPALVPSWGPGPGSLLFIVPLFLLVPIYICI